MVVYRQDMEATSEALFWAVVAYGWYAIGNDVILAREEEGGEEEEETPANETEEDGNGNVDQQEKEVCLLCHDGPATVTCEGSDRHGFCDRCFSEYAKSCFSVGGSFTRRIETLNGVSEVGSFPCPYFQHGDCSCHSFSQLTMRRHVTEEAFEHFKATIRRMAVAQAERQEAQVGQEEQEDASIDTHIATAVTEVLSVGSTMICPRCNRRTIKDDQCMHITCGECRCEWCYCCGGERLRVTRRADEVPRCPTCEHGGGIFLENHPGYDNRALNGESHGDGALNEYHRRCQAYLVRMVKEVVEEFDASLWVQFQEAHAAILTDIPTPGRQIAWEELATASPPTFGRTQPDDLQLHTHVDSYIRSLRDRLEEHARQQEPVQRDRPQAPAHHHRNDQEENPNAIEDTTELLDQLLRQQEQEGETENGNEHIIDDILRQMNEDNGDEQTRHNVPANDAAVARNTPERQHQGIRSTLRRIRRRRRRRDAGADAPVGYEV